MAGVQAAISELTRLQPGDATAPDAIAKIADFHRVCLPKTASSRAGKPALAALYRAVLQDPHGMIFWSSKGAFLAATSDLRATEASIRAAMPLPYLARLVFWNLLAPAHLFSRRAWEKEIPLSEAAYILTLGSASALRGDADRVSGSVVLRAGLAEFAKRGLKHCLVDTELSNEQARRFYEKNSFSEVKRSAGQVLLRKKIL